MVSDFKPITILYISNTGDLKGGSVFSLLLLLEGLDKSVFHPVVVCPRAGTFTHKLTELNIDWEVATLLSFYVGKAVSVVDFLKMWVKYFMGTVKLLYFIKKYSVALVHTNSIFLVGGAIAAKFWGIPHIWHIRDIISSPDHQFKFKRKKIKKMIFYLSSKVICNSKIVEKEINENKSLRSPKTIVVYNAINIGKFNMLNKKHKNEKIIIGTVGTFQKRKQQHIIPGLVKKIMIRNNDLSFVWHIYGQFSVKSKKYYEVVSKAIKEQDLEKHCVLKGFRDKIDIYSSLDILVHTAILEPFGRIFIEAMGAGIPVVSYNSGAVNEIIKNGKTGYIIENGNTDHLCAILCTLMKNRKLRNEIGIRGKKDVRKRFTQSDHVSRITKVYQTILNHYNRGLSNRL